MSLLWKDEFLVGHTGIDTQHRALFDWATSLIAAGSREMQVMVAKGLYDHTRTHFDFEERLMDKAGFPDTESHKAMHKALLKRLTEIARGIADRSLHIPTLEQFVTEWLIKHILTADADLAAHLRLMRGQSVDVKFT